MQPFGILALRKFASNGRVKESVELAWVIGLQESRQRLAYDLRFAVAIQELCSPAPALHDAIERNLSSPSSVEDRIAASKSSARTQVAMFT